MKKARELHIKWQIRQITKHVCKIILKMGRCVQQHKLHVAKSLYHHCPVSYWAKRLVSCSQEPVAGCTSPHKSSSHLFHSLEINFISILSSVSTSSKWSLSFRFSHQNSGCISLLSHTCHMPCHLIHLDFNNLKIFGKEYNQWHTSCSSS